MTTKFFILFSIISILLSPIFGQQNAELKDDTVFVTTEGPVEIKFPSEIFQASLTDSTAPFDIVKVGHSVQITAKSEAVNCASAVVDEGKRTHTLILCYSKTMNIENMNEAYFAYNTVEDLQKKVEQKEAAKLKAAEAEKARLAKKAMEDKID